MRKTLVTLALAGTLGLTGVALVAPSSALAQAGPTGERVTALKQALQGLVTDGTITSAQADKVATTLAEELPRHGHRGGIARLARAEVAKALGITVEELRTEREAGKTLAQIAADKGVAKATLITRLVAATEQQLAAEVTAGRLTQAQADVRKATLRDRITERVDSTRPEHGKGHRGHGPRDEAAEPEEGSTAPSSFQVAPA